MLLEIRISLEKFREYGQTEFPGEVTEAHLFLKFPEKPKSKKEVI